jgi:hypothetical protein
MLTPIASSITGKEKYMTREIRSFDALGHAALHLCSSVDSVQRNPSRESEAQNPAEALIRIGRLVQFLVRHGADDDEVFSKLGVDNQLSAFAMSFVQAPDWLKLRALVEDWSVAKISRRINTLTALAKCRQTAARRRHA